MDEQAQLAKLRRAVISGLYSLAGPRFVARLPLSAAEGAALQLNKVNQPDKQAPTTTFAIPLVGQHQVASWQVIEETLEHALKALIAQTDPNWRAIICSQTCPAAVALDPRITHLAFEEEIEGHDKVAKLKTLSTFCLEQNPKPGFFMPMDGDDLLHRDFVKKLHNNAPKGVMICGGYIVNAGNGHIGETRPKSFAEPLQKPFWKFCGSCMALPVGHAPKEETRFHLALAEHEHRLYPYLAKLAGYQMHCALDPRVLYVVNHGENFETRRGRGGFKQRFVERFRISEPSELKKIVENFPGLDTLLNPRKDDL